MGNNIIDNLSTIYQTKLQIKNALGTESDDFTEYPEIITRTMNSLSLAGDGGITYAYLSEQLSYYVEIEDLNNAAYCTESDVAYYVATYSPDLTTYATKAYVVNYVNNYGPQPDLSAYVTKVALNAASYASKSYVADYVNTYAPQPDLSAYVTKSELNDMSYATESYVVSYVTNYGTYEGHNLVERMEGVEEKTTQLDYRMGYAESYLNTYNTRINSITNEVHTAGYVSQTSLSNNSYATQTYVVNKLEEWSGNVQLAYYLNTDNFTLPTYASTFRLNEGGLSYTTYGKIYPKTLTYATDTSQDTYWVNVATVKNYMNGRLQQLEGSYVSVDYLNNQHFVDQTSLSGMTYATEAYVTAKIPMTYDMSLYVTYTYLYSYVSDVLGNIETILSNI